MKKLTVVTVLCFLALTMPTAAQSVVWYLLRPPYDEHKPFLELPQAPLARWRIQRAFGSAAECEARRKEEQREAFDTWTPKLRELSAQRKDWGEVLEEAGRLLEAGQTEDSTKLVQRAADLDKQFRVFSWLLAEPFWTRCLPTEALPPGTLPLK